MLLCPMVWLMYGPPSAKTELFRDAGDLLKDLVRMIWSKFASVTVSSP